MFAVIENRYDYRDGDPVGKDVGVYRITNFRSDAIEAMRERMQELVDMFNTYGTVEDNRGTDIEDNCEIIGYRYDDFHIEYKYRYIWAIIENPSSLP